MESHGQEEGRAAAVVVVVVSVGLQQPDGLRGALQVGQRPAGLLRHVDRTQQVGVETAGPPFTHLMGGEGTTVRHT